MNYWTDIPYVGPDSTLTTEQNLKERICEMRDKVIDNFDVKILDGYVLRGKITDYLNSLFDVLDTRLEEFSAMNELWKDNSKSLAFIFGRIHAELAVFEALGLIRQKKLDFLYELLIEKKCYFECLYAACKNIYERREES